MNFWLIVGIILWTLICCLIGFGAGLRGSTELYHIGVYDAYHDVLYFDEGKKPVNLKEQGQKIGVIDILYLDGRDENGRLS